MIFQTIDELYQNLDSIVHYLDGVLEIRDEIKLKEFGIDYLIYTAVLSEDAQVRHLARVYIRKLAEHYEVYSASIHGLYEARGKGEVKGFTVPAMNMRTLTYDVARIVFEEAIETESAAFIFEISRSEMKYTAQTQDEIAVCVFAAAIKTGYSGPVFLQGDHYQFNAAKYREYPQGQIDDIELEMKTAMSAGFYNIDIDASTLVDLMLSEKRDQQKENIEMTSLLTKFIRDKEPGGITVAVGGEIGHIGDTNSDVKDFEAFMDGYMKNMNGENSIISKVSVQTGTSHGGVVNADGTLQKMDVDFEVLREIGEIARTKYGMAGAVQHGASTLPREDFARFPEVETAEIHLATGIQNIIFDTMPQSLRDKLYAYVNENLQEEREDGWEDAQFMYKLRKKSLGEFKKDLWLISEPDKEVMREKLREEIGFLFEKLNIIGTAHTVRQYIGPKKTI